MFYLLGVLFPHICHRMSPLLFTRMERSGTNGQDDRRVHMFSILFSYRLKMTKQVDKVIFHFMVTLSSSQGLHVPL